MDDFSVEGPATVLGSASGCRPFVELHKADHFAIA
jgi:hypothetical protein